MPKISKILCALLATNLPLTSAIFDLGYQTSSSTSLYPANVLDLTHWKF